MSGLTLFADSEDEKVETAVISVCCISNCSQLLLKLNLAQSPKLQ